MAIGYAILTVCAILSADAPRPDVRPILEEWQRRSASLKTMAVRFTRETKSDIEEVEHTGRVILSKNGLSVLELTNKAGQSSRFFWTHDATYQDEIQTTTRYVWPRGENAKGRLPAILALPFLWNVSTDALLAKYRVEVLGETPDAWLLKFSPIESSKATAFLQLDRKTYFPLRYRVICGSESQDYRVTETGANVPVSEELTRLPDGWKVYKNESAFVKWFLRSDKPDLLP